MERRVGKCLLDNWVEERAVAAPADDASREQIQRNGHAGLLSVNPESRMEDITTLKSSYPPPVGPGVRERGIRAELLERCVTQRISEKVRAEFYPEIPATDFSSTTHRDFHSGGFVPLPPKPTKRTTAARAADSLFKRSALFSTPVTQRLDDQ
ncbi:hypothetical protein NHX12_027061 [Muraenolepis orangiensis]|uniref:Uncharacterized protein n=1 Tax=Muraenolepis orangiensis TaxID=630683 RepID=A0A9Q0ED22_9TELE|nr:hypothetical protein NHX12_027061 [Muraenolepis orangiensis]